ncbi:DUF1285 domain-containing protein [Brevundimonas sp.]|jgi:hypothetical protein|uniref:DUF1285 domain-containing protein n=1 Tax=Brevundimonas sp. TaxID=1871086 RepID=UPI002E13C564|nr:DUF1285 domain-containing protein [Brevundimonas sp.]
MTDGRSSDALSRIAEAAAPRGLPPVHLWNPPHCGRIDIVVGADGTWRHEGSPIRRPELVRLFSTVLRKDPDGYCLVTPVEKLTIEVEDLPFRAVAVDGVAEGAPVFTTDMGDAVPLDAEHPLIVGVDEDGAPAPRVHVRADLWARVVRPVFYELVEAARLREGRLVLDTAYGSVDLGAAEEKA